MQRLTLDQPIPETFRGSVVALGNFDGFHLGHQAVVGRAVARGFHERRPVVVAALRQIMEQHAALVPIPTDVPRANGNAS